jgi:hypothetical protein
MMRFPLLSTRPCLWLQSLGPFMRYESQSNHEYEQWAHQRLRKEIASLLRLHSVLLCMSNSPVLTPHKSAGILSTPESSLIRQRVSSQVTRTKFALGASLEMRLGSLANLER